MDDLRKYAPVLHTGFGDNYTEAQMNAFIEWCYDRGFSGFSAEGKSNPRTNDIDGWVQGFIRGLAYAAAACEKKGMDLWIFDEWGYPTGTAGGKTLENNTRWRSKKLHLAMDIPLEQGQEVELSAPAHFLAAAAWKTGRDIFGAPLSEDTLLIPADGKIRYRASAKRERLCVVAWEYDCFRTVGVFVPDPEDDRQGTLDLLSWEGVACFISHMHEGYVGQLGKYFGRQLKGFFYDEPYVSNPYPYTFDILDEFKKTKGYDITPALPRMLAGRNPQGLLDYRDVCTTRVAQAFYGQMAKWCHAHGVEMVGHQDLDHRIKSLDNVSGHFFKNSAQSDAPGVDYIWNQLRPGYFADFPRFAGSARRLLGKQHAISESFAATSSCLYPDHMRFCMEHQILRGIDRFFLMIADPVPEDNQFHTVLSKNHPQSISFAAALNRRVALTNKLVNSARPAAKVALYIPMAVVFRDMLNHSINEAPYAKVYKTLEEASRHLCYLPVDFDYLWKEALLDLRLEKGTLVTPLGQRIDTIIFPPAALEEPEIRKLREFIDKGGKVIFLNDAPEAFEGFGVICPEIRRLGDYVSPSVGLSSPAMLSVSVREDDEQKLYFILNENDIPAETDIFFPQGGHLLSYDYPRELWVNADTADGPEGIRIHETFEPMQLKVYALGGKVAEAKPIRAAGPSGSAMQIMPIEGWIAISPEGKEIKLGKDLKDWGEFYRKDYTGWMSYHASFTVPQAGKYRINLGRVCYAAKITIDNDKESIAAFAPFEVDRELSSGSHTIRVEILNTDANKLLGTTEAVQAGRDLPWFKTRVGTDRNYLCSGLLGPVTVFAVGES
ncbi:hypothetical protein AGMMS49579_04210 [Spirochaetia bacterium]|nr:hypothetical protein AGMMS49579_04210 [Spirochaetia bacterium]